MSKGGGSPSRDADNRRDETLTESRTGSAGAQTRPVFRAGIYAEAPPVFFFADAMPGLAEPERGPAFLGFDPGERGEVRDYEVDPDAEPGSWPFRARIQNKEVSMDLQKAARVVLETEEKLSVMDREISALQSRRSSVAADRQRAEEALKKTVGRNAPIRVFTDRGENGSKGGPRMVVVTHSIRTVKQEIAGGAHGVEPELREVDVVSVRVIESEPAGAPGAE